MTIDKPVPRPAAVAASSFPVRRRRLATDAHAADRNQPEIDGLAQIDAEQPSALGQRLATATRGGELGDVGAGLGVKLIALRLTLPAALLFGASHDEGKTAQPA